MSLNNVCRNIYDPYDLNNKMINTRDKLLTTCGCQQRQRHVNCTRKRTGGLTCSICGGPAHGYNFDAITCESCKAFFRRNALKPHVCIN